MFTLNTKKLLASSTTLILALGAIAIAPQSAKANPLVSSSSEFDELQNIVDGAMVFGGPDVYSNQSLVETFGILDPSATMRIGFEYNTTNHDGLLEFGIYENGSPENKTALLTGSQFFPTPATYQVIEKSGNELPTSGFGFYLETIDNIFYTEDILNPNGAEQSVVVAGDNQNYFFNPWGLEGDTIFENNKDWIIGFEKSPLTANDGYNDFVFMVQNVKEVTSIPVQPVEPETTPEPSTLAGLGLVGAAILAIRRRQS